jgi:hypothetical protein
MKLDVNILAFLDVSYSFMVLNENRHSIPDLIARMAVLRACCPRSRKRA